MASNNHATVMDLPLDLFTAVCQQLDLYDLVRVGAVCTRFRHGDGGSETAELPTKSPVVTALCRHAFPRPELVPPTRLIGRSESWVAYLARCARQRRCRAAPPMAAGVWHCLFVTASRRLLACGHDAAVGHGDARLYYSPIPVAAMAGVRVQSVAAGGYHSLALCLDGRVCSWGKNDHGQLGRGDVLARPVPALMEGLQGVRGIAAASGHSLAVTQQGYVFQWGESFTYGVEDSLRPTTVEGFGGVPMRRVHAGWSVFFTIGEDGEFFSCGCGKPGLLGHGDEQSQPSPKRVEALRGVRVSSAAVGDWHALALTEDGLVYAWGENHDGAVLSNPHVERELLPKPVEALRGVRVANVAAACDQSFAVADTGELWAWGNCNPLLGHGKGARQPLPKLIKSLRGIKVDAVLAGGTHTHVRADSGRVYSWGDGHATRMGVIGLGPSVIHVGRSVLTPQRIPGLRLACGLGV